jgi:N-dimethylarginine dimethylaminohydrolase
MSYVAKLLGLKPLLEIPEGLFLEGGDVIPICYQQKKYLVIGYGRRTTRETLNFLLSELLPKGIIDGIIGIELAQWRINLDGGMVPVAEDCIIAHPESLISGVLLDGSETAINPINFFKDIGFNFIEVTQEESLYKQACNCFCLGGRRLFAYDLSERVHHLLKKYDVEVIKVKGQELVKGTGGPRCMTRPIYTDVTL